MNKASGVAAFAALMAVVDAANLHLPRATVAVDYALDGISPVPTFPAGFVDVLAKRAGSSAVSPTTVLVAPDNTCGYISGRAGAAYTCGVGASCIFFTSSAAGPGHIACCNTAICVAKFQCIDYNQYFSQSKCDNGCAQDAFTLKCTNTAQPYCNTLAFPNGVVDVYCNNLNISGIQAASTTFSGESARVFTPLVLTGDASSSSRAISVPTSSRSSAGGSVINNPANTSPVQETPPAEKGGSKTPVGAIVGGVVGGVGGLVLIGIAAFFLLRKKPQPAPPPTEQVPPTYQSPPPPMQQQPQQPPPPQAYYDPKYPVVVDQQSYPPPNQQYMQNGGYYPPTNAPMSPDQHHAISPAASTVDPRMSTTSPIHPVAYAPPAPAPAPVHAPAPGGFQPPQGVIYEAPSGQPGDHHHGQMHELAS